MTTTPDALTTAEQAPGIMASHGDECAAALITELERLRAIEAAARAFAEIEEAYSPSDLDRWATAFDALRIALANGGAK